MYMDPCLSVSSSLWSILLAVIINEHGVTLLSRCQNLMLQPFLVTQTHNQHGVRPTHLNRAAGAAQESQSGHR